MQGTKGDAEGDGRKRYKIGFIEAGLVQTVNGLKRPTRIFALLPGQL